MLENKQEYTTKSIRAVDDLLDYSVFQEAENLLIEKEDNKFSVKLDFYGELKDVFTLSEKVGEDVLSRIKEMAGIKLVKEKITQSGKFKKTYPGFRAIFSVLTKKEKNGETIIINILNEKPGFLRLKKLGFTRGVLAKIENNLKKENGGILVVGGFNSGKTTTLYGLVDFINKPELNVSSIEKDIFYDMPFVNQSLLNFKKGFNYSFALSSILRQDPDVIMIDEINERESIESFFDIAQRGYLVLAGVYSKNILTCLDFFNSFGVDLSLLARTVKVIINQELVRKNCIHCLVKEKLDQKTKTELMAKIDVENLIKKAKEKNIISAKIKSLDDLNFYKSKGCEKCKNKNNLGYFGVFEVLEMTDDIKKLIKSGHISRIRAEIKNQDGVLIEEDALLKAMNGIISLDQVLNILNNKPL